ncbi:MAG: hypothetical protein LBV59_11760 [Sphingobacterium sp.]|jgi:hypothetical protein|uniref:hypothetical protein n=1 Tax=Sphingobacterium sp. TaxID=341027 RepID=UPI002840AD9B|nr:hypothetical protein [Sphingobacterium sp.]MDR3008604.1 hypothetical protein [Sphingobacterium sp.]
MRHLYYILLIFTLSPLAIYAKGDVAAYRNHINLAELALVHKNYKVAQLNYKKATDNFNGISALNLNNALQASILLGDVKTAKKYAWKLSELGINPLYFTKSAKLVQCFIKDKKFWKRLIDNCSKQSANQKLKYAAYRSKFNGILDIHHQFVSNKTLKNFKQNPQLSVQYTQIIDSFTSFIKVHGFPTEHILGIETKNDTLINEDKAIYAILGSYYKGLSNNKTLDGICVNAVKSGELDNYDFALLNDQNPNFTGRFYGTSNYYFVYNCTIYEDKPALVEFTKPKDTKARIDSFRKIIHLDKLDNSYQKMNYSLTDKDNEFLIRDQFTLVYPFSDKELQAIFLANKRLLGILKDCK